MTNRQISFRCAVPADLPQLVRLETENFDPIDIISARQMAYHIHKNPGAYMIVAETKGCIMGYILCFFGPTGYARIYSLVVDKLFRGKGLAQEMIEYACEEVRKRKAHTLGLEVRISNKAAISLYEKMGFKKKKIISPYYDDGTDAAKMQRVFIDRKTGRPVD